jgi:hypothetical protein
MNNEGTGVTNQTTGSLNAKNEVCIEDQSQITFDKINNNLA